MSTFILVYLIIGAGIACISRHASMDYVKTQSIGGQVFCIVTLTLAYPILILLAIFALRNEDAEE